METNNETKKLGRPRKTEIRVFKLPKAGVCEAQEPEDKELGEPEHWIPSKRVYICSQYGVKNKPAKAKLFCEFAKGKRYVPICPHLYFPIFLDYKNGLEQAAGYQYSLQEMWKVNQIWVIGEYLTEFMEREIKVAKDMKIKVRYFTEGLVEHDGKYL